MPVALPQEPSLAKSFWQRMAEGLDPDYDWSLNQAAVTPLTGSELAYEAWLARYGTIAEPKGLADYHKRIWGWIEDLEQGVRPPALVECIFRGGGKSSTIEHGIPRVAVKATRKFCLYVCANQEAASKHVGEIADTLEHIGVKRALSEYGIAEGWNATLLRCSNGFTVLGVGLLDNRGRGVKIKNIRPDWIVLDDIDSLGDSPYMTRRKLETIKSTIILAGSTDVAITFIQNEIFANSIMAQTLDGRADMLHNRVVADRVPAIYNFEYERYTDEFDRKRARIISGTPSWPEGKPIPVLQREIDDSGLDSFLRECQHDVHTVGVYFTNFSPSLHVRVINRAYGACRVCNADPRKIEECVTCGGTGEYVPAPWPIPHWWRWFGGLDYGRSKQNPFAFLLNCVDDNDHVKTVDEIYESSLSPEEQAEKVLEKIVAHGLSPADVNIWCDPSIFPPRDGPPIASSGNTKIVKPGWSMTTNNGKYIAEIYREKGLQVRPAMSANTHNERVNGWGAVNHWLDTPDMFTIYDGRCPEFVRTFSKVPSDPNDDRDVDTTSEDHLPDCARFMARARIGNALNPATIQKKTHAQYMLDQIARIERGPATQKSVKGDPYAGKREGRFTR